MFDIMKTLLSTATAILLTAGVASAATLSFTLADTQGSASTDTDVIIEDIFGGVTMSFTVSDALNSSDLVAVYMNFVGSVPGDVTVNGVAPGGTGDGNPVTIVALDTNNVAAGNIGETFDLGVAIGNTGSGGDFFSSFMLTILGTSIDISDFYGQTFAVRGQSVGPAEDCFFGSTDDCGESSKEFGTAGTAPDPLNPIPLPAAGWMLIGALGGLAALRRKRRAA